MALLDILKGTNELEQYKQEQRKKALILINEALINQDTKYELFFTTGVIDTIYELGIITDVERCNYRELADNKDKANRSKK